MCAVGSRSSWRIFAIPPYPSCPYALGDSRKKRCNADENRLHNIENRLRGEYPKPRKPLNSDEHLEEAPSERAGQRPLLLTIQKKRLLQIISAKSLAVQPHEELIILSVCSQWGDMIESLRRICPRMLP